MHDEGSMDEPNDERLSRWARFRRAMTATTPRRHEVFRCPKCNREITRWSMGIGAGVAGIYTPWTERETLARCPVHGFAPWNSPAVRKIEGDENYQ
jgi:uncharacterized protein with PIN domain